MIEDKDIVFVTTTLYTKWLDYQSEIIKKLFPDSQHIIVDGRGNWPNSWFYWIDEVKKSDKKYYIHIDEDFFITSKDEVLKVINKMESSNIDLIGCSDGYHHFRAANGVAINTFFMCGRVSDIKRINIDLKSLQYQLGTYDGKNYLWLNSANLKFKEEYKNDFVYNHRKFADSNFESEQEPYYAFLWLMKDLGCKFDYLYPHFDDKFKSTNPRLTEDSEDIGIHMWYTRQWNSDMDVWGMPNIERYNEVEKYIGKIFNISKSKMINIYINIAMIGSVNQVLWDLLTRIKQSGLYDSANKIYLVFNGDRKQLSFNLVSEKYVIIDGYNDISKCEFPTLELIHKHSKDDEFDILYLHTKGVTKPGVKTIEDWTNYLSYFNINKWKDRLKDLETNDASGVNLGGNPDDINSHPSWWGYGKAPVHYSGNFWWSKSSHIKNLPSPFNWLPDTDCFRWRMMAEMWLCQIKTGKYSNAWHSNVNHYQENYPKELYETN